MRIHSRSQAVGEFCAWINPTGRECPLRACLRRPVCVHRTGRGFGRQVNARAYWFRTPRLENAKASFRDSRSTSLVNQLVSNSSARKCESKLSYFSRSTSLVKNVAFGGDVWRMCKRGLFPFPLFHGCRVRKFSLHLFYHFMLLASGESCTGWYQAANDDILFEADKAIHCSGNRCFCELSRCVLEGDRG